MRAVSPASPPLSRSLLGAAAALLGVALAAGCGDDIGQASENATDSFVNPTDHGELVFGVPNPATFDEEHRFHAWHFALTDAAKLDLRTELHTVNLDSVMYLYTREPGADQWGSYVAQNDDHDGQLASRILGDFGPGEYLIKVKATKTTLRGDFSVHGACEGAGCPPPPGDACDPNSPIGVSYGKGFTNSCGGRVLAVLRSPVTADWAKSTRYDDRCELGGVAAKSVEYYHDYWDGWIGWEDFVGEPEETWINVNVTKRGDTGTVVRIDIGADEDTLYFVYDHDDKLLLYYHSEQSSTSHWECGIEGEPDDLYPDEECAGQGIYVLSHQPAEVHASQGVTTPANAAGDLGSPLLGKVVSRFAVENGLGAAAVVDYRLEQWDAGAELELSANGKTTTYYPGGWYDDGIVARTDGDVTAFVCESLE